MDLTNMEPKKVFAFFEELTRIPHESGHTAAVSGWVEDFARKRGCAAAGTGWGMWLSGRTQPLAMRAARR